MYKVLRDSSHGTMLSTCVSSSGCKLHCNVCGKSPLSIWFGALALKVYRTCWCKIQPWAKQREMSIVHVALRNTVSLICDIKPVTVTHECNTDNLVVQQRQQRTLLPYRFHDMSATLVHC